MASKDFDTSTGQIIYDKRIYNMIKKYGLEKLVHHEARTTFN